MGLFLDAIQSHSPTVGLSGVHESKWVINAARLISVDWSERSNPKSLGEWGYSQFVLGHVRVIFAVCTLH